METTTEQQVTGTELALASEGDDLRNLVLAWISAKRSVNTRHAYLRDIGSWLNWCTGRSSDPLLATEVDASTWARHLDSTGYAASTAARKLSAASSWYAWLLRHKHVAANPFTDLARPVVDGDTSSTPGMTREQALALLAAGDQSRGPQQARNAALVAVLLFTGARSCEVIGANVEDLGTDRGHRVLRVTRKGGKRYALALPPPAISRIDAYLSTRPDAAPLPALPGQPGLPTRRPLFVTESGGRLLRADVWALVRRLGKAAGLPADLVAHLGPHSARHTFITLALDAGVPLRDVQDAAGHADPRTTRRYDRARHSLDRSPGYDVARYLAQAAVEAHS